MSLLDITYLLSSRLLLAEQFCLAKKRNVLMHQSNDAFNNPSLRCCRIYSFMCCFLTRLLCHIYPFPYTPLIVKIQKTDILQVSLLNLAYTIPCCFIQ